MIFNSASFLIFFIIFFQLYWWISRRFSLQVRNVFIIAASYLFYGWWDWRFLGLIVLSSTIDFVVGLKLEKSNQPKAKKRWMLLSVFINLGILGFFKYFNFFVAELISGLELFSIHLKPSTLNIILPVGISFYTFQTMSYTIDVYRNKMQATRNIASFFAFVSFFPQLVAGPIERASHLLPQFNKQTNFNYPQCVVGLRLVLWGFFKKLVIADNFGILADQIFEPNQPALAISTMAGAIFFAIQIYADFSGYSDIAIGISRMLGFDLMQNFKTPYFASTFTNFWGRWHISLSTWFRDYVYIPLGGNRVSSSRNMLNILITFLLSGLWHGANLTFVIWGGLHGAFLLLDKKLNSKIPKWIYRWFVLVIVILLWLPFRAINTSQLWEMVLSFRNASIQNIDFKAQLLGSYPLNRFFALIGAFAFFIWVEWQLQLKDFGEWISSFSKPKRLAVYYSLLILILLVGSFDVKPSFIYFQF